MVSSPRAPGRAAIAWRYKTPSQSAFQSAAPFRDPAPDAPQPRGAEQETRIMIDRATLQQLRRGLAGAALVASLTVLAMPASAGECPADKTKAGVRTSGEMKPKDVTDNVLGMIELGKEKVALADRRLRLRKLVVQPGGIVPWHSHEDRPALIYIVSGQIHEYASNCAVAIEHKAGEVSVEKLGVQHYWKNNGKTAAVLLSADLFRDDKHEDEHTM